MSDEPTETPITYAEAAHELEAILQQIESGAADIDVLSERVQRAATLIKACRDKLASTEVRVRKVVEGLVVDAPPPSPAATPLRSAEGG